MSSQFNSFLATARRDDLHRSGAASRVADRLAAEGEGREQTRPAASNDASRRGRFFSLRKA